MRKQFLQAIELMVAMDHEFMKNSTSSPFAFPSCPFHMGISPPLKQQLTKVFWDRYECEKPKFLSCANTNFVYL